MTIEDVDIKREEPRPMLERRWSKAAYDAQKSAMNKGSLMSIEPIFKKPDSV